jgi:hypothetical protein
MEKFEEVKKTISEEVFRVQSMAVRFIDYEKCKTWEELKKLIIGDIFWLNSKNITLPDGKYYEPSNVEFTVVNGRLDGEYKEWNEDGKLLAHFFYKNGLLDGECKEWWEMVN